ncbi:hypothetical protein ACJX0J_039746, partial [Zea mays]
MEVNYVEIFGDSLLPNHIDFRSTDGATDLDDLEDSSFEICISEDEVVITNGLVNNFSELWHELLSEALWYMGQDAIDLKSSCFNNNWEGPYRVMEKVFQKNIFHATDELVHYNIHIKW